MSKTAQVGLQSSSHFDYYATVAADKDLVTLDPFVASGNLPNVDGRPCRQVVCLGNPGNITLKRPDGTSVTFPILQGMALDVQAIVIVAATTTATGILVLW